MPIGTVFSRTLHQVGEVLNMTVACACQAAKPGPVTYGDALPEVEGDHVIKTDPQENSRRRTIVLEKRDNSWGFTLQVSLCVTCRTPHRRSQ